MDSNSEETQKNLIQKKKVHLFIITTFFFPFGYYYWYKKNNGKINLFYPLLLTVLTILLIISYIYIYLAIHSKNNNYRYSPISDCVVIYLIIGMLSGGFLIERANEDKSKSKITFILKKIFPYICFTIGYFFYFTILINDIYGTTFPPLGTFIYFILIFWNLSFIYINIRFPEDECRKIESQGTNLDVNISDIANKIYTINIKYLIIATFIFYFFGYFYWYFINSKKVKINLVVLLLFCTTIFLIVNWYWNYSSAGHLKYYFFDYIAISIFSGGFIKIRGSKIKDEGKKQILKDILTIVSISILIAGYIILKTNNFGDIHEFITFVIYIILFCWATLASYIFICFPEDELRNMKK